MGDHRDYYNSYHTHHERRNFYYVVRQIMKIRTFYIILAALLIVCAGLTVAHLIYDSNAYQQSSIIYFISKEMW